MVGFEQVREHRARGEAVTLHRDALGNHWAEVHSGLLIRRRKRIDLDRDEYDALKPPRPGAARMLTS